MATFINTSLPRLRGVPGGLLAGGDQAQRGGRGGAGRGGTGGRGRGWQLESMMMEDEQAMGAMASALEKLRRESAPPNQPPSLMGAKPFFLDRRAIATVSRGSSGVLWPASYRGPAAPPKR